MRGLFGIASLAMVFGCGGSGTKPDHDAAVIDGPDAVIDGPPDAGCVDLTCTNPPVDVCASTTMRTSYPSAGTCDVSGTCVYTPTAATCTNGCFGGACNGNGPSYVGDATATSTSTVTLDKVAGFGASSGSAPANAPVAVQILATPNNAFASVSLIFSVNDFTTTISVAMTVAQQTGGNDTFTATINGQPAGTTVRFYFLGKDHANAMIFHPGGTLTYTYVTQ